jgi:hypothetical protein
MLVVVLVVWNYDCSVLVRTMSFFVVRGDLPCDYFGLCRFQRNFLTADLALKLFLSPPSDHH